MFLKHFNISLSRQSLESLESVVDEDPVLGPDGCGWHGRSRGGNLQVDVGEVVEVRRVVDALHGNGNGGRTFPVKKLEI